MNMLLVVALLVLATAGDDLRVVDLAVEAPNDVPGTATMHSVVAHAANTPARGVFESRMRLPDGEEVVFLRREYQRFASTPESTSTDTFSISANAPGPYVARVVAIDGASEKVLAERTAW